MRAIQWLLCNTLIVSTPALAASSKSVSSFPAAPNKPIVQPVAPMKSAAPFVAPAKSGPQLFPQAPNRVPSPAPSVRTLTNGTQRTTSGATVILNQMPTFSPGFGGMSGTTPTTSGVPTSAKRPNFGASPTSNNVISPSGNSNTRSGAVINTVTAPASPSTIGRPNFAPTVATGSQPTPTISARSGSATSSYFSSGSGISQTTSMTTGAVLPPAVNRPSFGASPNPAVTPSTSAIRPSAKPASLNTSATADPKTSAYNSLAKSTFPIAPYTQTYITKMATVTSAAAGTPGSSAGFAGWTPGLEKTSLPNGKSISPNGRGYCTDYVAATYNKISGNSIPVVNADKFYTTAQANKLPTLPPTSDSVRVAPPGSVIVWKGTGAGHVAIITANDPAKKTITISESNWGPPRKGATEFETKNEITSNFNVVTQRTLTYDKVAQMSGQTASGGTYTYSLAGFVLPSSGFENH